MTRHTSETFLTRSVRQLCTACSYHTLSNKYTTMLKIAFGLHQGSGKGAGADGLVSLCRHGYAVGLLEAHLRFSIELAVDVMSCEN